MCRCIGISDKHLKEFKQQVLYFSFVMEKSFYLSAINFWNPDSTNLEGKF